MSATPVPTAPDPAAAHAAGAAPGGGAAEAAVRAFWARVAGTTGTRVLLLLLVVASSVLSARVLGPQGLGVLTVMLTLGALGVQLGTLGLPSAAAYLAATRRDSLPALIGGSLLGGLAFGSLLAAGMYGLFLLVPALAPLPADGLLLAALAWIPFSLLSLLLLNILLGLGRIPAYNVAQLLQGAAALMLMLALYATGRASVPGFYAASLVPLIVGTALLLIVVLRAAGGAARLPSAVLVRSAAGYGFRAYLALLFSFTVLKFDLLMIARMLGQTDAGHYAIASSGGELVTLPFAALGTVLFGAVASSGVQWVFVRRVTLIAAVVLLPCVVAAAFLAAPAVRIVFGAEYLPAVPAILWLLPGLYALGVNTILMHWFAATGMPLVTVLSPALASVLNVLLNLLLLPRLGIAGAALSSTAAYAVMLACSLLYIRMKRPG